MPATIREFAIAFLGFAIGVNVTIAGMSEHDAHPTLRAFLVGCLVLGIGLLIAVGAYARRIRAGQGT